MEKSHTNIVTLRPKWSVRDMFIARDEASNRQRILTQLEAEYLSKGWELADDIHWGKDYRYAVLKLDRVS